MMTIVTRVKLRAEGVDQWDATMHARLEAAHGRQGWVSAQLLKGVDQPLERAIVGVWMSKNDWESWHNDDTFRETRDQLSGLEDGPSESNWFEVVENTTRNS
ncbi:antibiotic biosynthesis monooxygenase [Rhodococcus pyridinivorans]|uniref:antibiotic biosynthesis monooxygenase family protein n=1 Tax=Rhodococcus pyridinivorans TaxID=103816 RepID=UPI0020C7465E|nr:antibiotic biosynthesis monooxygenase [Rhodococcus pyridinivorans]UTM38004.1 antibiotic biosynthesis monooxygenase [Rhodococcus pyridinivorans]